MIRGSARSDTVSRPALLDALGQCREVITREMATMKVPGPLYYSASAVVAAIDALALMLTGQRDYFQLRLHNAGVARDGAR
jgi:hypothetical protein